jgi:hypothetical protein
MEVIREGNRRWENKKECQKVRTRILEAYIEVKLSLSRPWRPLGLRDVESPTFSDIRLTDGGKVVSPTRWPLFTPRKIPGTHFC